jgi:hypothetical protein
MVTRRKVLTGVPKLLRARVRNLFAIATWRLVVMHHYASCLLEFMVNRSFKERVFRGIYLPFDNVKEGHSTAK